MKEKIWKNTYISTKIIVILISNPKYIVVLYRNKKFPKIATLVKVIEKMQPIDEKYWKNSHISTKILVILISKSQPQIYNSTV